MSAIDMCQLMDKGGKFLSIRQIIIDDNVANAMKPIRTLSIVVKKLSVALCRSNIARAINPLDGKVDTDTPPF